MRAAPSSCLLLALALPACNLALGLDDHEAYPPDCGVELNDTAIVSFSDDESGHCYSVVHLTNDPMMEGTSFDYVLTQCNREGGSLACVNDKAEFDLINTHAPSPAWLGIHSDDGGPFECVNGQPFDQNLPIWEGGGPPDPMNGNCVITDEAALRNQGCGPDPELVQWVCEFEPAESDE